MVTRRHLLFFHDNGCNPEIISTLILLTQSWASLQATAEKRAHQIQLVNNNIDSKIRTIVRAGYLKQSPT